MPSERIQRHIDRLLDEADQAIAAANWSTVPALVQQILALDPDNADALAFLVAAERMMRAAGSGQQATDEAVSHQPSAISTPPAAPGAESVGARLIAPAPQQGTDAWASPSPRPSPAGEREEVPTAFASGRYVVKRFLGEGGKKQVYRAYDELLDRDVAFALIKTDGLDETGRARIKREAQAMGRLGSHPHIVSVYDMGEEPGQAAGGRQQATEVGARLIAPAPEPGTDAQGAARPTPATQPYIVTELMAGGDVEELIEKASEHRSPLERTLEIGIAVCRGLEFAHGHGIVHRDLKPGNVWLNEDGTAKLGDFGLAVALDRSRLTQAGMMVGTVSYMPPEQAMGGEVTPRSDLYSLGAMLYEMVTGRPPFVGDESVAIITQHLNVAPVAPSWHNPSVPPGLEVLILRLLEKDPAKRPASAAEVGAMLESIAAAREHPSSPALLPQGEKGGSRLGTGADSVPLSLAGEGRGEGDAPAGAGSPTAPANPLYRRVFVGREAELRQLQAAVDAALSGQGGLVMVVGEPGIGKTALCEQLATYVILRGGVTLTGHCYEEGSLSLPYLAFVEALRAYAVARPPEALRQELGSAATDVARIVSEVRERLAVEPRPPGDPEEDRWRLLQAVSGFLRHASTVQPLLLILEDLHWADLGTLDLLVHVARNLQGARLLVIGTYRDVEVDRGHPLSATLAELQRGPSFGRVQLRGLGTPEVQQMLAAITDVEAPGSLAETIHRQTEGNPLFVQEVIRYLVEEGHLGGGVGGRVSGVGERGSSATPSPVRLERGPGGEATAMAIPEGLRDVIGKRLSRLSPDCNRLLAVAAVIGRDFGLQTLQAVAGLDEEPLVSALEEAVHIGVLEEQSRVGVIRYRFAHAFFRQTLYEELIAPRRLRLHQRVAAALERQYAARLEDHAAELAEHFAQSTDRDDLAKAVRYGELAANRALSVYAYGEAVRHLEQALAVQEVLDPDDTAKRCDLLLALGEALVSAGESTRAVESVAPEALRLAEGLGDHLRASRACRTVQRADRSVAFYASAEAQRWAQPADRHAEEGTIDRVYADVFLFNTAVVRGDTARGLVLLRRAAQLAQRLDDPLALVITSEWLLNGVISPPEAHGERIVLAEELSKRSLEEIDSTRLADTLLYLGETYLTWGRREEAERHWQGAKEAAARSHDAEIAFIPFQVDALIRTLGGQLERVPEIGAQIRARGAELDREQAGRQAGDRAVRRALIYLGRVDEALAGIPDRPDLFFIGGVFASQRTLCLAHMGRTAEAREILQRMLAARDMSRGDDPTSATVLRYLLEASVLLGDVGAARVLAARMEPLAGLLHTTNDIVYCIGRLCGGAAALLGETDKARGYYEQAIAICTKVRFRPELALTRLELAELMLDEAVSHQPSAISSPPGRRTPDTRHPIPDLRAEALTHLDFAIAEFRDMKMQPSLERALRHKEVLKA